jgi:hypothetical protein
VCLYLYGFDFDFQPQPQHPSHSLVDFVGSLKEDQDNLVDKVLCEAKSPSVMRRVGDTLPQEGVELKWNPVTAM